TAAELHGRAGFNSIDDKRREFACIGGWLLTDIAGGRERLRELLDPLLLDLVDDLQPTEADALSYELHMEAFGSGVGSVVVVQGVRGSIRSVVGTVIFRKPAVGLKMIAMRAGAGDLDHFARMRQFASAGRRPAAVLFADLEGSTPLAKRLPTAGYLAL